MTSAVTGPMATVVQQRIRFVSMKGDSTVSGPEATSQRSFGLIDRSDIGAIDFGVVGPTCAGIG